MDKHNTVDGTTIRLSEALIRKAQLQGYAKWWPLLLGPAAMLLVYIAYLYHLERFFSRRINEDIALILLCIALINFCLQACVFRSNFYLFMACLSGAFFCREWHFYGTSIGIYVVLALLAFWWIKQKDVFDRSIGNGRFRIWLVAVFVTYLLSQLIARRVFRYVHLSFEGHLHTHLEESVETAAHLMLIAASFTAWKLKNETRLWVRKVFRPAGSHRQHL